VSSGSINPRILCWFSLHFPSSFEYQVLWTHDSGHMSFIDDNAVSHLRLSCNCKIAKCSSSLSVTRMCNFCSLLALPSSKILPRYDHSIWRAYLILYIKAQLHSGLTIRLRSYQIPIPHHKDFGSPSTQYCGGG
jgi:hypothetical protein